MKQFLPIFILLISLLPLQPILAQSGRGTRTITTMVPFLGVENEARSASFGSITAVAPLGYYASGLDGNPATLAQGQRSLGGHLNYSPWLSGIPITNISAGGWISLNDRHVIGITGNAFSLRGDETNVLGQNLGEFSQLEQNYGFRYAMALTPFVSMGIGMNVFSSRVFSQTTGSNQRLSGVSGDWGLWIHDESHNQDIGYHWQLGLAVQDLGPKTSYDQVQSDFFLPTRMKLGGLMGLRLFDQLDLDLAYQAQKLLVPSVGANQDLGILPAAIESWTDSPEGLIGEWQEIRHHVAIEQRWQEDGWWLAFRQGYTYEAPATGDRRTIDLGGSFGYMGIRFDVGYSAYLNLASNERTPGIWRFGLVSSFNGAKPRG